MSDYEWRIAMVSIIVILCGIGAALSVACFLLAEIAEKLGVK